jgi:polyvinyl alcohol dehydrogenase (cytochrome)
VHIFKTGSRGRAVVATAAVAFVIAPVVSAGSVSATVTADWAMGGQGIANTRYQPNETQLSTATVASLHPKWIATMGGDVSATPAVVSGAVYAPDWGGYMSKLDAATGAVIWRDKLDTLLGNTDTAHPIISRTSPAVSGNDVLIGTQVGGYLLKLDATTGALVWKATVDPHGHPLAIVTNSPVVFQGIAYVGVASTEEAAVAFGWPCCSFRGSMSAFKVSSGARLWSTDTIDDASYTAGFKGVGVWGSTATVDQSRRSLYITTGNDYAAPQSVKDCEAALQPGDVDHCEDAYPGNHVDSVMSLDLNTGAVKWTRRLNGYDTWNVACIFGNPLACPNPAGPDYDFGQGAMLIKNGKAGDVLAAGQKSGFLWGLDPQTGAVKWSYFAGPGSSLGGLEWGSATDGKRIYYALVNLNGTTYSLTNPAPGSASTTNAGLWGAVDVATGHPIWQHADPNDAIDLGPVSVANGVLYASSFGGQVSVPGSSAGKPTMFALDAQTGAIDWQYVTGATVNAGPAIANGSLYWGGGYSNLGLGDPDPHLYAFN